MTATLSTSSLPTMREFIRERIDYYFASLRDERAMEVYDMLLAEVEAPLIQAALVYTRGTETKAAKVLGLSRGTLRKLRKQYGLYLSNYRTAPKKDYVGQSKVISP